VGTGSYDPDEISSFMLQSYKSLVLSEPGRCAVEYQDQGAVKKGMVMVSVEFSGLNYKDALAVTGTGKIVRAGYPFVPGIDLSGTVINSEVDDYCIGDRIVLTGGGLGELYHGGYSQIQEVHPEYLIKLDDGLSTRQAMVIGTAGMTAILSVMALEAHGIDHGTVLVTGASGAVGMLAVKLLSDLGFTVIASCASSHLWNKISRLGASEIIDRVKPARPLDHARYDGVVDTVGGVILSAVLSQVKRHGCVATSGNVAGVELNASVYPFILRGITLAGIDSNTASMKDRITAWKRLHALISEHDAHQFLMATIALEDIESVCQAKIRGEAPGNFLVDLSR